MSASRAEFTKTVISDAYGAVCTNALNLLRVMWLPVLLSGVSLYFALDLYFTLLQKFLALPSPRDQSLALAAGVAGVLSWVFFHAIAAMTAIRSTLGLPHRTWLRLRIRRAELRMFACILRLLGIIVAWATFLVGAWFMADKFIGLSALPIATITFFVGAIFLWVRVGFVMPAVVAAERVKVLRRSWLLTRGYLLPLLLIWLLVTMPPLVLMEVVGDVLLKTGLWIGPLRAQIGPDLDAETVTSLRAMLPGWIFSFTICTAISLALTVMASLSAYRHITDVHDRG